MPENIISQAEASSPFTYSSLPTFTTSNDDFNEKIASLAKWKDRSEKTHKNTHIPELQRRSTEPIEVILLGSSMFERFKNTGATTRIGRLLRSFNAGVGGDKIPSVLYRIQLGLLEELKPFQPKLWVVSIGTNDLRKNRGFGERDFEGYRVLMQALLRAVNGSRVISTAISYRRDIKDWIIDESNEGLRQIGEELNQELGVEVVRWLDAPKALNKNRHQVDHVHYNKEGYQIWDEVLFPVVDEMLKLPAVEFGKEGEVTSGAKGEDKAVAGLVKQAGEMKVAPQPAPVAAKTPAPC
jgi:lysophospholipase L1-like esterase